MQLTGPAKYNSSKIRSKRSRPRDSSLQIPFHNLKITYAVPIDEQNGYQVIFLRFRYLPGAYTHQRALAIQGVGT